MCDISLNIIFGIISYSAISLVFYIPWSIKNNWVAMYVLWLQRSFISPSVRVNWTHRQNKTSLNQTHHFLIACSILSVQERACLIWNSTVKFAQKIYAIHKSCFAPLRGMIALDRCDRWEWCMTDAMRGTGGREGVGRKRGEGLPHMCVCVCVSM